MSSTLWLIGVQGRSDPPDDWYPAGGGMLPKQKMVTKIRGRQNGQSGQAESNWETSGPDYGTVVQEAGFLSCGVMNT